MSSQTTSVKTIRIKNEVLEYFKDKPLNRYVESLYEHIESGEIEEKPDGISVYTAKKEEYVLDKTIMRDIEQMCGFFGIGIEDFFKELCKSMNNGDIVYENGVFKGQTEINVENFMESCHRANRDAQEMIDKCAQMIERSRI